MDIVDTNIASRDDILARYRHLRAITIEHHREVLRFVSRDAIFAQAKRLGLLVGKTVVAENESEDALLFDLLLHTSAPTRSRAIDRYARSRIGGMDADRASMIEAMQASKFSIWRVERRHEQAGLVLTDLFRQKDVWLVDVGLEASLEPGVIFASRFFRVPEAFCMTSGVFFAVDEFLLEAALDICGAPSGKTVEDFVDSRRFAEAFYRAAISEGALRHVEHRAA